MDHSDYTDDMVFAKGPQNIDSSNDERYELHSYGGGSRASGSSDEGGYESFSMRSSGRSGGDTAEKTADYNYSERACADLSDFWDDARGANENGEADEGGGDYGQHQDEEKEKEAPPNRRLSWWRQPQQSSKSASDSVDWGDEQITTKGAEQPAGWFSFRRRASISASSNSSGRQSSFNAISSEDEMDGKRTNSADSNHGMANEHLPPLDEDVELNQLLFPRRGSTNRRPTVTSVNSKHSTVKMGGGNLNASMVSHGSDKSNLRGSIAGNSLGSKSQSMSSQRFNSYINHSEEEDVEEVIARNSMNLGSIEKALLADMVSGDHSNRWKKHSNTFSLQKSLVSLDAKNTILEENSVSSSQKDTVETVMETQLSPRSGSDGLKNRDMDSLSSEEEAKDGVYCSGWSVSKDKDPQDPHNRIQLEGEVQDTLPAMDQECAWDTAAMLTLKNSVSLSKTHVIDDVSSIASSDHSGRIVQTKLTNRSSFKMKNGVRNSFISQLGGWRNGKQMLGSTRTQLGLRDNNEYFDQEDDDNLEDEVFAATDARHAKVVREAMGLMDSVNKSVASMGMEAPFRPIDEVSMHWTLPPVIDAFTHSGAVNLSTPDLYVIQRFVHPSRNYTEILFTN